MCTGDSLVSVLVYCLSRGCISNCLIIEVEAKCLWGFVGLWCYGEALLITIVWEGVGLWCDASYSTLLEVTLGLQFGASTKGVNMNPREALSAFEAYYIYAMCLLCVNENESLIAYLKNKILLSPPPPP